MDIQLYHKKYIYIFHIHFVYQKQDCFVLYQSTLFQVILEIMRQTQEVKLTLVSKPYIGYQIWHVLKSKRLPILHFLYQC